MVIPARPRKPRDKAKVETGVQIVERWILAALRNRRFFSLAELNRAIAELLVQFNNRPFQKLEGSRRLLYEIVDRPPLWSLPLQRTSSPSGRRPRRTSSTMSRWTTTTKRYLHTTPPQRVHSSALMSSQGWRWPFGSFSWMMALSKLSLAQGYPLMALSFVFVLALTPRLLGEAVSPLRWTGVLIIVLGHCRYPRLR